MSEQAKEILFQFLKFENLVMLMQIANSNIDFVVSTDQNIVEFKTMLKGFDPNNSNPAAQRIQQMTNSILMPNEFTEHAELSEASDELILGRLTEFCPEAFMPTAQPRQGED